MGRASRWNVAVNRPGRRLGSGRGRIVTGSGEEAVALLGGVPVRQHEVHELRDARVCGAGGVCRGNDLLHHGGKLALLVGRERLVGVVREGARFGRAAAAEQSAREGGCRQSAKGEGEPP